MDASVIEEYTRKLKEEQVELKIQLPELRANNESLGPQKSDSENAALSMSLEMRAALIIAKELRAQKVQYALDRIAMGRFGHCFECREEIPEKRLRNDPTVIWCRDCAEKKEAQKTGPKRTFSSQTPRIHL